jgi:hypothetical protein
MESDFGIFREILRGMVKIQDAAHSQRVLPLGLSTKSYYTISSAQPNHPRALIKPDCPIAELANGCGNAYDFICVRKPSWNC